MDWISTLAILLAILAFALAMKSTRRAFPPGPKPLPFIGNLLQLRPNELWLLAESWARDYASDVIYLHVLGQPIVFLSSSKAISDLLDKRGSIYSDRPRTVMCGELCNCQNMVAMNPYGDGHKRQRRLLSKALGPAAIPAYHPLITEQTKLFLQRLVQNPDDYIANSRAYAGATTLSVVYGYEVATPEDPFLKLGEESVRILGDEITAGGGVWAVDVFPWLKHTPRWLEWLPGMQFKEKARVWRAKMEEFVDLPYEFLKQSMESTTYHSSVCSSLLCDQPIPCPSDVEEEIKWAANSMFGASMDTTVASVTHLLLTLIRHPEVLEKAQAEIDAVVGPSRLPTFTDRPSLPYIDCVLNEIWRYGAPVPICLPHRLMQDDTYRGWDMPRGTLVLANIYALTRSEDLFDKPTEFLPERYAFPPLESIPAEDREAEKTRRKLMNPRNYVFGFGRRVCPGIALVEDSIWLLFASMLAALDIRSRPQDSPGPDVTYDHSFFRIPSKFGLAVKPRNDTAARLIAL